MRKYQSIVRILDNRKIGPRHFLLRFHSRELARASKPGQFLMVRISDTHSPLLRRPFGVHAVENEHVSILFEVVGQATEILSRKTASEKIGVIGPLGSGFDYAVGSAARPVLVAGGMGAAPLLFLAQSLAAVTRQKPLVLLGARTASCVVCEKDFRRTGCAVKVATDDGSKGYSGYVSGLVEQSLRENDRIFACGPKPMLKEIARVALGFRLPAQLSLEAHMSCGFGACLGCVVNTTAGYKRVCQEGPVFQAEDIIW